MTRTIHGSRAKPAILILHGGIEMYAPEVAEAKIAAQELAGTLEVHDAKHSPPLSEFDLVVHIGTLMSARSNVSGLSFGGAFGLDRAHFGWAVVEWSRRSSSTEWIIEPSPFSSLVRQELSTWVRLSSDPALDEVSETHVLNLGPGSPLVSSNSSEGGVVAGLLYPRLDDHSAETPIWWMLPKTANKSRWIRGAIEYLNTLNPEKFPLRSQWNDLPPYMPPDELAASKRLRDLKRQLEEKTSELQRMIAVAEKELADASSQATASERLLVSANDEELVDAVQRALEALGFQNVTNPDPDRKLAGKQRREDLNFRHENGEVCIAEVKGSKGGAAEGAVTQITQHEVNYVAEHDGTRPDRKWLIVNQFRARPPSDRRPPLESAQATLDSFAENDGLIIDTSQLLELQLDVAKGERTAEDVRVHLWNSRGRLDDPPLPSERSPRTS